MAESDYGHRDKRGHYKPDERVSYPPVFVWPLKPIGALKWAFSIPGYFVPWNLFYVLVGLLSWFYFSQPLVVFCLDPILSISGFCTSGLGLNFWLTFGSQTVRVW